MLGQITELPKAQGVCDIKVTQISATHMKNMWRGGVVVITTAQLHSTKPELWFYAGSNPASGVSEIRDGEDL